MKSVITGLIALIIIGTGAYPQEMTDAQDTLMKFASFADDKHLEIDVWTITKKEKFPRNKGEVILEDLQKRMADPHISKGTHAVKYVFKDGQKNSNIVETYSIIFPKSMKSDVELVYTIEGQGRQFLTASRIENEMKEKSRLFSKSATIFTCLKASKDDIINDVLVYQEFKQAFNVAMIDVVDENGWTSRSGFTKQWDQSIPYSEQSMNVQFATRTLGGQTNITIGTPIITAEY